MTSSRLPANSWAAGELVESLERRHVRRGEVPGRDDDLVELLGPAPAFVPGLHGYRELPGLLVVADPPDGGVELDELADVVRLGPPGDVVAKHFARRERRDRLPEVLVEGVVGELEALLGPVGPQVAVLAAVYWIAVLVEPGAPGVVPQSTPVALLLETSDLGDLGTLPASLLEGVQLCQPARSGANHGDP
jgi:hypothetical protein